MKLLKKKGKVLDLGCGTGNISKILKEKNYNIFGLDIAINMLKIAKKKGLKNIVNASFYKIPFKSESFDIVISIFDSLNNVKDLNEMKEVFSEIYRVLKIDGIFTFDLNTIYAFKSYWNNLIRVEERSNIFVIWEGSYISPNSCILKITIFQKLKNRLYKKHNFEILEVGFHIDSIIQLLKSLNFRDIIVFEHLSFRKASEKNYRVQFVAKK
ncbi:MAG: class I SAM-dependent methyltransferase [candidate division WOR-3 bacterium]|nr:class I SAM-dependent methyltransferase [candidate division WOR-3 bacterium]